MRSTSSEKTAAALLIVDIDKFHSINDSLGYSAGDRVLTNCAEALQKFSSSPDDLARLGKDEFALLRWQHPKFKSLSPNDFIPIAEANDSIIALGDWVLEKSCQKLVKLAAQHSSRNVKISVNVSAVQFRRGDFVARVKNILQSTGANPQNLCLELTESLIADDINLIIEQMASLRELGVSISLDDFGTGYASLAYLTRLPLDELKIDRAFVRDLDGSSKGALLTETIISLGRSMNLTVIAEGVETEQQFKRLHKMGCQHFQGYLFAKPAIG